MKSLLTCTAIVLLAALAQADIQQPPASEWGPTRKLGRGLGNIAFGLTELPTSMMSVNYFEGNSAAFSYGIVRGLGRTFARLGYGLYDTFLFPFPNYKGTYAPPTRATCNGSGAATPNSRPSFSSRRAIPTCARIRKILDPASRRQSLCGL